MNGDFLLAHQRTRNQQFATFAHAMSSTSPTIAINTTEASDAFRVPEYPTEARSTRSLPSMKRSREVLDQPLAAGRVA